MKVSSFDPSFALLEITGFYAILSALLGTGLLLPVVITVCMVLTLLCEPCQAYIGVAVTPLDKSVSPSPTKRKAGTNSCAIIYVFLFGGAALHILDDATRKVGERSVRQHSDALSRDDAVSRRQDCQIAEPGRARDDCAARRATASGG